MSITTALVYFAIALALLVCSSYLLGERQGSKRIEVPAIARAPKPPTRAAQRLQRRMIRETRQTIYRDDLA